MADKEKAYTLKTVQAELAKLEQLKEKKKARVQELTAELKAVNTQIKELEAIYDQLYREDVQRQIGIAWFDKRKMTKEEIKRMLEISVGLPERINNSHTNEKLVSAEISEL